MTACIALSCMASAFCCIIGQKIYRNDDVQNWIKFKKYVRKTKKINKKEICVICQDDYSSDHKASTMYCNHTFHKKCLKQWLNQRPCCPLCNINLELLE